MHVQYDVYTLVDWRGVAWDGGMGVAWGWREVALGWRRVAFWWRARRGMELGWRAMRAPAVMI